MFDYDEERLGVVIQEIARLNISSDAWTWLQEKLCLAGTSNINAAFSIVPRQTGKHLVTIQLDQEKELIQVKPGYELRDWTTDRLCRVCLLMTLDPADKDNYFRTIENLFLAAEMSELVALYSALPILAYPGSWRIRCAEGIRSNIGPVLEAIMYNNPYPATYLDEHAWNQLVLKAFFTDKDVNKIYGFDERANLELAMTLSDYAHERWAAGRSVNPLLWRATSKFINDRIISDLNKVFEEGIELEKRAAALAIYNSGSGEALNILNRRSDLQEKILNGQLTWDNLQVADLK